MRNYKEYSLRNCERKERKIIIQKKNSNSIMFAMIMLRITNLWAYVNFAERHWKIYMYFFLFISFHSCFICRCRKKTILEVFNFTCAFGLLLNDLQNRYIFLHRNKKWTLRNYLILFYWNLLSCWIASISLSHINAVLSPYTIIWI